MSARAQLPGATIAHLVPRRLAAAGGGRPQGGAIVLLAGVLALGSADSATIGAVAAELKRSLSITNTDVGLLAAVASLVGALATIPVGMLTDRVNRTRLLAGSIALWSVAMVLAGASTSFAMLLVSRLALGAVLGAAGPVLASLAGDFFAPAERARVYGWILSGELIGSGIGLVGSGFAAAALSWRYAFWLLAPPSALLAWLVWRRLPEPARGRSSERAEAPPAQRAVRAAHVEPDPALVLREDPLRMGPGRALRYVLRIRTNLVLIAASVLGYFFFAGMRIFAVVFVRDHFGLGQGQATALLGLAGLGALGGVLAGGRIADRLVARGHASARLLVAAVGFLVAAVLLVPAIGSRSLLVSVPLFVLAAAALAAPNPPLDAARLDIVHPRLWGRAESVRTLLKTLAEALAPLAFGLLADALGSPDGHRGRGVEFAFLIMLVPLAAAGAILLRGRRHYPRDVATAAASLRQRTDADLRPPRDGGEG
ncbi:MAG TPA: MFS transporter [Conexibacter sp.]|nr:MFS transporter [Conexibacter sp.]